MRKTLHRLLSRMARAIQLQPEPDAILEARAIIAAQEQRLNEAGARDFELKRRYLERAAELIEAKQMCGAGPWLVYEDRGKVNRPGRFKETSNPLLSQGAFSDMELALQNVEWRREVNLSWLEFSRWGIQQIILISRLYYIKNPWIQRGVNVAAYYVFGRGVEISSPDETANEVLKEFFEANKSTLGQIALTDLERRKYYDGNIFFVFFPDTQDTGKTSVRTIDATEMQDIVCDPEDSDRPWFYRRMWVYRAFNEQTGQVTTQSDERWYPALGYEPTARPATIGQIPVEWDHPILHRKCGAVSKWNFGCPLVYAALDWAKAGREFLEACATVRRALAQIAMTITTKGGQQALEGIKQQMQTQVGVGTSLWDTNPPAVNGSTFASGPDTVVKAFNTQGAGGDPSEVKEFRNMVACVFGEPPTFLGDMETSNLATAKTLDRPTELNFKEKQEVWREDLTTIAMYALKVSMGAPTGRLREAKVKPAKLEVTVNFPAILEGDIQEEVAALVDAMTLGNKGGQVVGIDEKAGVRKLYDLVGIEDGDELTEEQYPDSEYEPDRTKEVLPDPVQKLLPAAGGQPKDPNVKTAEALSRRLARRLIEAVEAEHVNGHAH